MMKINLKALSAKELTEFIGTLGQSPYRARQGINWIYKKHAISFDEMTDMSKSFRELLEKTAFISNMKLIRKQISKDGTQKFLLALEDGETIESVLIPDKNRLTLCISSQVGCAAGCKFCMTGRLGLKRNLKAHEIVDQIIAVQRLIEQRQIIPAHLPLLKGGRGDYAITNIVFMGMGEPLLNFTEVIEALWRIINFIGFSKKRITLSTVGIIPKIFELADKGPQISLAVSLNATTDTVRNKIMPINRKYPIKKLIKTCREFPLAPGRKITFEYVLIDGINDSKDDALRLVKLLKGIKSKVNLIQYNPCSKKAEFRNPSEDTISVFQKILLNSGMTVIIRKSRGEDISAACGQLGYKNDTQSRETLF
ncbi:MAG: 23S rRNA (adenine(2503)-C(2))-methyltransferase RlmN [Candidatus Mariimomonas ferrooxydans]